jgi:hypothetical protein
VTKHFFCASLGARGHPAHAPLVDAVVLRYTWEEQCPLSPQTRGAIAVLGRLGMFRTTKERQFCLAGVPTAMGHCMSRCAPRLSAGHALCLAMPVVTHDKRAAGVQPAARRQETV